MASVVAHGGLRDPWGKPHGHQSQLVRRPKCMTWREADVRADDGQTIVHNGMVMHSKKWGSNMKAFIYATPPPFLGRPESTEALGYLPLGHEFQVLEFKDCTHYVSVRFFDRELPPWRNAGWINVWKRKQAGACRENDLGLMICYPCGGRGGRQRSHGRRSITRTYRFTYVRTSTYVPFHPRTYVRTYTYVPYVRTVSHTDCTYHTVRTLTYVSFHPRTYVFT